MKIKRGTTSLRRLIFIGDSSSSTGAGLANLTHASSGLVWYYYAGDLNNEVQVTLVTATLGTYTSGGFVAVDNTNMPGWYEIGIPDAALDGGVEVAMQLRGATNMAPVNIYLQLDAVDYQDATAFGLSRLDAAITSRMATYTQPTGFLTATFPTTVASTTNITAASGVTLAASQPGVTIPTVTSVTNAVTLPSSASINITGNITGNVSGSVGSVTGNVGGVSGVTFPSVVANDATVLKPTTAGRTLDVTLNGNAGIDWGNVENQGSTVNLSATTTNLVNTASLVTELGPDSLTANSLEDLIASSVWNSLTSGAWVNGSFGERVLVGESTQRSVSVTGSHHVAADIHELQPAVITAADFAAGAIDANALAADAASEIATAVGTLQVLTRLESMIESDGAGQFRFDTIALSMAPAGGGGGGGTDWTSSERTAIRSILGFNSSGVVVDSSVGILDEIRDGVEAIGINVYPVSSSTPERVNGTTITVYRDEQTNVTISTSATLTGLTLRFVAENREGDDVLVVENAAFVARTSTSVTLLVPSTVTDEVANYSWTLRDVTSGNSVLARGVLAVQAAASKDA